MHNRMLKGEIVTKTVNNSNYDYCLGPLTLIKIQDRGPRIYRCVKHQIEVHGYHSIKKEGEE
jgi:hypothetical protein